MPSFRRTLLLAVLFPALAFAQNPSPATNTAQNVAPKKSSSKALTISPSGAATGWRAIHNSALIIDTHADTPGRLVDENFDLAQDAGTGYLDFNKIKAGNLGAEFFSIWVNPWTFKGQEIKRSLDMIDSVYEQARLHPDKMMMAFSTQDILAAHRQHKLAALLGVEGGHAIQGDMRVLRDYYRLGVRYMTLTWSNTNELGDSSGDLDDKKVEHHDGITTFGRQVVREMNRLGMMVDISHVADRTFLSGAGLQPRPGHRLAFIGASADQRAAQYDRRHADRARSQRRRRAGEFLLRLHLAEVGGRDGKTQSTA